MVLSVTPVGWPTLVESPHVSLSVLPAADKALDFVPLRPIEPGEKGDTRDG